jgi:hypothetical protein
VGEKSRRHARDGWPQNPDLDAPATLSRIGPRHDPLSRASPGYMYSQKCPWSRRSIRSWPHHPFCAEVPGEHGFADLRAVGSHAWCLACFGAWRGLSSQIKGGWVHTTYGSGGVGLAPGPPVSHPGSGHCVQASRNLKTQGADTTLQNVEFTKWN